MKFHQRGIVAPAAAVVMASALSIAATFAVTSAFYEDQLDRLAANPLCAAACNVLKAVRR